MWMLLRKHVVGVATGGKVLISFFGPKLEVQRESERRRVGGAATEQE